MGTAFRHDAAANSHSDAGAVTITFPIADSFTDALGVAYAFADPLADAWSFTYPAAGW